MRQGAYILSNALLLAFMVDAITKLVREQHFIVDLLLVAVFGGLMALLRDPKAPPDNRHSQDRGAPPDSHRP